MRASIQQIETFYWVARLGGFHAAARHQHLTQPAISARIQELEELLGAKLFERSKHRATLTLLGGQLLPRAERILRLTEDFGGAARQPVPMRGLLRLGTNESAVMAGLVDLLTRLRLDYPELQVELTIDIGSELCRRLKAKELDVAILMDPVSAPYVIDEPIGQAELQWVASSHMALPGRALLPEDLSSMSIILTPPPSALFSVAADWFKTCGSSLDHFSSCNSVSLIAKLVAAGHGISVLPMSLIRAELEQGVLQCLPAEPARILRTYYISFLKEEQGSGDNMLVRIAKEVLAQGDLLIPL